MDTPPADHGSDRYDHIEIQGVPEGAQTPPLPPWLTDAWMPCLDCRANAFLRWLPAEGRWYVQIAHDDGCPTLARIEGS